MYTSSRCAYVLALALLPYLVAAIPIPASVSAPTLSSSRKATKPKKGGIVLPFKRRSVVGREDAEPEDGDVLGGSVGLGNSADL